MRPLAHEALARLGMRLRGKPLGLDTAALARLGEHTWPGNDAELGAVLLRAALVVEGDVVRRADLDAIGFAPVGTPESAARPRASAIPMGRRKRAR